MESPSKENIDHRQNCYSGTEENILKALNSVMWTHRPQIHEPPLQKGVGEWDMTKWVGHPLHSSGKVDRADLTS